MIVTIVFCAWALVIIGAFVAGPQGALAAVAGILVAGLVVAGPLAAIWAVNLIFGFAVPYTFKTWCAAAVLTALARGWH